MRVCVVVAVRDKGNAGTNLTNSSPAPLAPASSGSRGRKVELVILRTTSEAKICLACLVDATGRPSEWLELWIQDTSEHALRVPEAPGAKTNLALDRSFTEFCKACLSSDPAGIIMTGWESRPSAPLYIDPISLRCVVPRDPRTGAAWSLCLDEEALRDAALDSFAATAHRYLWTGRDEQGKSSFASVTPGATTTPERLTADTLPGCETFLPLNPGCGRMTLRRLAEYELDSFCDFLSGADQLDAFGGNPLWELSKRSPSAGRDDSLSVSGVDEAWLTLSETRIIESLFLRLRLWSQAVDAVQAHVRATGRPMLNVSVDSFRVACAWRRSGWGASWDGGMPALWGAWTTLANPGASVEAEAGAGIRYFVATAPARSGVYSLESASEIEGLGTLRVRKVRRDQAGLVVEADLKLNDLIEDAGELLELTIPCRSGRVKVAANPEPSSQTRSTKDLTLRLTTLPSEQLAASGIEEGDVLRNCVFRTVPMLGTPADLYALFVVGARLLATNAGFTLAQAVADLNRLAGAVSKELPDGERGGDVSLLTEMVGRVLLTDPTFGHALGPHLLRRNGLSPSENPQSVPIFDAVPANLWHEVLALLITFIPAQPGVSWCQNVSEPQTGGLGRTFDAPLAAIRKTTTRVRSMIAADWYRERELASVVIEELQRQRKANSLAQPQNTASSNSARPTDPAARSPLAGGASNNTGPANSSNAPQPGPARNGGPSSVPFAQPLRPAPRPPGVTDGQPPLAPPPRPGARFASPDRGSNF